jgi:hypothetical protein
MKWLTDKINNLYLKLLKQAALKSIRDIKIIDQEARLYNLQNEQWFINWQDEINKISVK